jgi:hypothetical protein
MLAQATAAPSRPVRSRSMCRRHGRIDVCARRHDLAPSRHAGSIPPPGVRARATRLDPAVYRRRRRVVGVAIAMFVAALSLAVQAAIDGPGSGPASAAGAGTVVGSRTVRAMPGDSLWNIAEDHHGDVDINRYVDELVELNGGTSIVVGQRVRLP